MYPYTLCRATKKDVLQQIAKCPGFRSVGLPRMISLLSYSW